MTRTFVLQTDNGPPLAHLNLERELNEQQLAAVTAGDGPKLVIAGAGSGKTRTITYRVAFLMAKGVPASSIMLATFTNKAAREMLGRVESLIGTTTGRVWGGTFHSIGNRILRHQAQRLGFNPNYSILDDEDQRDLIKVCMAESKVKVEEKRFPAASIVQDIISFAFNTQQSIDSVLEKRYPSFVQWVGEIQRIDVRYVEKKRQANAMDYDDLLRFWWLLMTKHPDVAQRLGEQFRYVLVDEYQDTNIIQSSIVESLAAHNGHNLMVVGDDSQCVRPGTRILTPTGERPVETLKPGDLVLAGAGNGRLVPERISVMTQSEHPRYRVIRVEGGYELRASPNHLCFAKVVPQDRWWYVYLMYQEELGFRIGVSHIARSRRESRTAQMRTAAEQADKLWLLEAHPSRQEAQYREAVLSLRYQIPQALFRPDRRMASGSKMTLQQVSHMFTEFGQNGLKLLQDYGLLVDHPSFEPKASRSEQRIAINLVMAGAKNGYGRRMDQAHEVVCESYLGREVIKDFPGVHHPDGYWRLRKMSRDYRVVLELASQLQQAFELRGYQASIHHKARFVRAEALNGTFRIMPAAGLLPGMKVPVVRDGQIVPATIESVEWRDNVDNVPFYDLEVERSHNIVSDGIVTHNSIYAFRGANYDNILKFPERNPGTEVFKLEINYRSTPEILAFTNASIHNNVQQFRKTLRATRTTGTLPVVVPLNDVYQEAAFVAQRMLQLREEGYSLNDMAILYRAHAHSTILQAELVRRNIPYEIRSGVRFFEQAHIKDVIAYLKIFENPFDEVAWRRLLLMIPRIGNVTAAKLWESFAPASNPLEAAMGEAALSTLPASAKPFFKEFQQDLRTIQQSFDKERPDALVTAVLGTGYAEYLKAKYEGASSRAEDIEQLAVFARSYTNLQALLSELVLLGELYGQDVVSGPAGDMEKLVLSSVHQAKGLEWKVVFVLRMSEGEFPSSMGLREADGEEEERRIFYVAATRAKDELYLSHPLVDLGPRSTGLLLQPSRFLQEIPFQRYEQASVEEMPRSYPRYS